MHASAAGRSSLRCGGLSRSAQDSSVVRGHCAEIGIVQEPGNMWLPDPHPYAAAEVWPPITEVDVSMYPWLSPVPSAI